MNGSGVVERLEVAVRRVAASVPEPTAQPPWQAVEEHVLWYELVACILGSRVRFEQAFSAAARLEQLGLLDTSKYDGDYSTLEARIQKALSELAPLSTTPRELWCRYPYPRLRANHIRRSAENLYGQGGSLHELLKSCATAATARKRLATTAVGIGPKQASLFLRNIGYADDIAVLDIHVLRYMRLIGLASGSAAGVQRIGYYEDLEGILQSYARKMQTKLSILDTAIWVVMRAHNGEATG
jgi:N-glycosylase/DNA lyase